MALACACGHRNRTAARFCAHCGAALPGAPAGADGAIHAAGPSQRAPSYEALRDRLLPAAALLLLLTVLNVVLVLSAGPDGVSPGRLLAAGLIADLSIVGFAWPHRAALAPLLRPARVRPSDLLAVVVCGVGLHGFVVVYGLVLAPFGVELSAGDAGLLEHGWPAWSAVLMLAVQPAVFEELAFRGYLLERFDGVFGRGEALLLQGALFAIVHMLPLMFVSHFVMGLLLGLLRERSASLYPPIALHAAWNAFVVLS